MHVCFYKEVFILPIKIADGLDAVSELKKEGIVTIGEKGPGPRISVPCIY